MKPSPRAARANRRSRCRVRKGIGIVVVLLLAGYLTDLWRASRVLYRAAPTPAVDPLERVLGPSSRKPVVDWSLFEGAEPVEDPSGASVVLAFPQRPNPIYGPLPAYTVHEFSAEDRLEIAGGSIWLESISVAYRPLTAQELEQRAVVVAEPRVFHPSLEPMTPEEIHDAFPEAERLSMDIEGVFPEVRWVVRSEGLGSLKGIDIRVLDARNGDELGHSMSVRGPNDSVAIEVPVRTWAPIPHCLVLDLAQGPVETRPLLLERGATVETVTGDLRFIGGVEGVCTEIRNGGDPGDGHRVTLKMRRDPQEPSASLVFGRGSMPGADAALQTIEVFDRSGRLLESSGGIQSASVHTIGVNAPLVSIHSAQYKRFPNVRRLIIHIPSIPGLPEENADLENLFDMRIPYVRAQSMNMLSDTLEALVRLRLDLDIDLQGADRPFPLAFEDTTPRRLLRELERRMPMIRRLDPDPASGSFVFRFAYWFYAWAFVSDYFDR